MPSTEQGDIELAHAQKLIRAQLARCSAMRHDRLAEATGLDAAVLQRALAALVQNGTVDIIRPITDCPEPLPSSFTWHRTYYRLRRPADGDFLWQKQLGDRLASRSLYTTDHSSTEKALAFLAVAEDMGI